MPSCQPLSSGRPRVKRLVGGSAWHSLGAVILYSPDSWKREKSQPRFFQASLHSYWASLSDCRGSGDEPLALMPPGSYPVFPGPFRCTYLVHVFTLKNTHSKFFKEKISKTCNIHPFIHHSSCSKYLLSTYCEPRASLLHGSCILPLGISTVWGRVLSLVVQSTECLCTSLCVLCVRPECQNFLESLGQAWVSCSVAECKACGYTPPHRAIPALCVWHHGLYI